MISNCVICGKELTTKQMKFCSKDCARVGHDIPGLKSRHIILDERYKECTKEFTRFIRAFSFVNGIRLNDKMLSKLRIFSCAMREKHLSADLIGKVTNKKPSTIKYHLKQITEEERFYANQFLTNTKYKYNELDYKKLNLYRSKQNDRRSMQRRTV